MTDNFDSRISVEESYGDGRDEVMESLADELEGPEEEIICGICEGPFGDCDCEDDIDDWYDDDIDPGDMDGDHDSAMTSCGWGTDEDYGCYGDDC